MPLKLAILQADSVMDSLQPRFGDYPRLFGDVFAAAQGAGETLQIRSWRVVDGEYPAPTDAIDGFVITGSRQSVYEDQAWIHRLQDWIVAAHAERRRVVGICFGHQLIAQALGGAVRAHPEGWTVGLHGSSLVAPGRPWWMTPAPSATGFSLVSSHRDQVVELPAGAQLLATNGDCPNAAFTVGEHFLTFQGHPEMSDPYIRALLGLRRELLGDAVYGPAVDSLRSPAHAVQVARWILNFIAGRDGQRAAPAADQGGPAGQSRASLP